MAASRQNSAAHRHVGADAFHSDSATINEVVASAPMRLAVGGGIDSSRHTLCKASPAFGLRNWAGVVGLLGIRHDSNCYSHGSPANDRALIAGLIGGPGANDTSDRLMKHFGNLRSLMQSDLSELTAVTGTEHDARKLKSVAALAQRLGEDPETLSDSDSLLQYLKISMGSCRTETFRVLFLDTQNALLSDEVMWQGSPRSLQIHPQEVLRRALVLDASSLIVAHNHPSNTAVPSPADISATKELLKQARVLGLTLHDHLVITLRHIHSMRIERTIDPWE
jgi:DNA repair protein RadC